MRRYSHNDDLGQINSWRHAHELREMNSRELPDFGVIEDGVLAGFLVQTDTNCCFVDGFISNPNASSYARGKAIMEIGDELIRVAKEKGYSKIMVITQDPSIMGRVESLDFEDSGFNCLFVKEI